MGGLSKRRLGGANGGNTGKPLRKVIARVSVGGVIMEAYECGHICMPKSDIIGHTNAARRRCARCAIGKPVHFTGEPPTHMTAFEYDVRSKYADGRYYSPPTGEDWKRVFELRCKEKRGADLTSEEREFCQAAFKQDEKRYSEMTKDVFEATKPFGAT